jgi:low temperature requirement protein LtrA
VPTCCGRALALQQTSPLFIRVRGRFDIQPSHFVERHGALVIVVFGESVVDIGIGAEGHAVTVSLALAAYFFAYIPMLLGVVALASGVKQAIVNTGRTLPAGPCVALGCGVALFLAGSAAFRHALRIGPGSWRLGAAGVSLAASAVGVAVSVAAEIALLTLIVAAALVLERRAAPDSVEA